MAEVLQHGVGQLAWQVDPALLAVDAPDGAVHHDERHGAGVGERLGQVDHLGEAVGAHLQGHQLALGWPVLVGGAGQRRQRRAGQPTLDGTLPGLVALLGVGAVEGRGAHLGLHRDGAVGVGGRLGAVAADVDALGCHVGGVGRGEVGEHLGVDGGHRGSGQLAGEHLVGAGQDDVDVLGGGLHLHGHLHRGALVVGELVHLGHRLAGAGALLRGVVGRGQGLSLGLGLGELVGHGQLAQLGHGLVAADQTQVATQLVERGEHLAAAAGVGHGVGPGVAVLVGVHGLAQLFGEAVGHGSGGSDVGTVLGEQLGLDGVGEVLLVGAGRSGSVPDRHMQPRVPRLGHDDGAVGARRGRGVAGGPDRIGRSDVHQPDHAGGDAQLVQLVGGHLGVIARAGQRGQHALQAPHHGGGLGVGVDASERQRVDGGGVLHHRGHGALGGRYGLLLFGHGGARGSGGSVEHLVHRSLHGLVRSLGLGGVGVRWVCLAAAAEGASGGVTTGVVTSETLRAGLEGHGGLLRRWWGVWPASSAGPGEEAGVVEA